MCAAVGLCDQSSSSQTGVTHSRKLMAEGLKQQQSVGDDTFCQFCTMAVSYIKVIRNKFMDTLHVYLGCTVPPGFLKRAADETRRIVLLAKLFAIDLIIFMRRLDHCILTSNGLMPTAHLGDIVAT